MLGLSTRDYAAVTGSLLGGFGLSASLMAVDPSDDRTFWFTHEYYTSMSGTDWNTRIGSFNAVPETVALSNEAIATTEYYEARSSITAGPGVTLNSGANVTFRLTEAGTGTITLNPGFTAQAGSIFNALVPTAGGGELASAEAFESLPAEVDPVSETTPATFSLAPNHPNPFNPSTVIEFTMAETAPVSLRVYDVLGREVKRLVDGYMEAGTHRVQFEAAHLSSGVYFYQMRTGRFVQTRKMTLLE